MVKHTIDFVGNNYALKNVTINGKVQELERIDRNTNRVCFQTESDTAEVILYETHQYTGKCWFLIWLFFYIISLFGLLDVKQNKRCLVTYLRFSINDKVDTYTIVTFNSIRENPRVAEIASQYNISEIANEHYYDQKAKKIHKRLGALKFFTWLAILITLAFLLFNALI